MNGDSPSLWPSLATLAGALGGLSVLWGAWLNWRKEPVEHRLITVQADATEATRDKTRAETESLAIGSVERALAIADRTITKLEAERDLLALQLDREVKWRQGNGWPAPPEGKGG